MTDMKLDWADPLEANPPHANSTTDTDRGTPDRLNWLLCILKEEYSMNKLNIQNIVPDQPLTRLVGVLTTLT